PLLGPEGNERRPDDEAADQNSRYAPADPLQSVEALPSQIEVVAFAVGKTKPLPRIGGNYHPANQPLQLPQEGVRGRPGEVRLCRTDRLPEPRPFPLVDLGKVLLHRRLPPAEDIVGQARPAVLEGLEQAVQDATEKAQTRPLAARELWAHADLWEVTLVMQ